MKLVSKALFAVCIVLPLAAAGAGNSIYRCSIPGKPGSAEFTDQYRGKQCKALDGKEPQLGMTPEQAKLMLGEPKHVSYLKNRASKTEQWVFDDGLILHFKNGVLEVIEQK